MKIILLCFASACLIEFAYSACTYSKLSQADRNSITNVHNNYRSTLAKGRSAMPNGFAPPAKNMYTIVS
uniref:SCP domain-containing protein n=1 Tax=Acrobeloides nanus TaxID=290746 RepID=A0A914ELQ5_9BILA